MNTKLIVVVVLILAIFLLYKKLESKQENLSTTNPNSNPLSTKSIKIEVEGRKGFTKSNIKDLKIFDNNGNDILLKEKSNIDLGNSSENIFQLFSNKVTENPLINIDISHNNFDNSKVRIRFEKNNRNNRNSIFIDFDKDNTISNIKIDPNLNNKIKKIKVTLTPNNFKEISMSDYMKNNNNSFPIVFDFTNNTPFPISRVRYIDIVYKSLDTVEKDQFFMKVLPSLEIKDSSNNNILDDSFFNRINDMNRELYFKNQNDISFNNFVKKNFKEYKYKDSNIAYKIAYKIDVDSRIFHIDLVNTYDINEFKEFINPYFKIGEISKIGNKMRINVLKVSPRIQNMYDMFLNNKTYPDL
jgi:hypothetical protein